MRIYPAVSSERIWADCNRKFLYYYIKVQVSTAFKLNWKYSKSLYDLEFCHNIEHEVIFIIFTFNVHNTL